MTSWQAVHGYAMPVPARLGKEGTDGQAHRRMMWLFLGGTGWARSYMT